MMTVNRDSSISNAVPHRDCTREEATVNVDWLEENIRPRFGPGRAVASIVVIDLDSTSLSQRNVACNLEVGKGLTSLQPRPVLGSQLPDSGPGVPSHEWYILGRMNEMPEKLRDADTVKVPF